MLPAAPSNESPDRPVIFSAAEYVRMSTEHQQYSTENQADAIREYARRRGIQIVRTYADEGKSGLRIDGRQALQQLIRRRGRRRQPNLPLVCRRQPARSNLLTQPGGGAA